MLPGPRPEARRLAVLIDAENADAQRIEAVLNEVARHGTASVKRAYGDWTKLPRTPWRDRLNRFAIQPIQQFGSGGKNASDIALVIDAMDLLHSCDFHTFCLVSSDRDFTRLACRLRESGVTVYGFGRRTTLEAFVRACDRFTFVEDSAPADEETPSRQEASDPQGSEESDVDECDSGPLGIPPEGASQSPVEASPMHLRRKAYEELVDDIHPLTGSLSKACLKIREYTKDGRPPPEALGKRLLKKCAEALALLGGEGEGTQP